MKRVRCGLILIFAFHFASVAFPGDERSLPVDFVFLVDRSLSMKPVLEDVKRYLAADVIGPLVLPGDSVTLLAFYGKVERVWQGRIQGEAEKAALVRSLHKLVPNGRYTDIGRALDYLDPIIKELDAPERVKYVLLLTDERQEAPPGSPYGSKDFTVSHPYLTYVNRKDLGTFRAITIGLGLDDRIASNAEALASFLKNPPDRSDRALPGTQEGSGSPSGSSKTGGSGAIPVGGASENGNSVLPLALGIAAGAGVLVAAILAIRSMTSKKKEPPKKKKEDVEA